MTARQMIDALRRLPEDCLDLEMVYDEECVFRDLDPPEVIHVDANGKPTLEPTMFRYIDVSHSGMVRRG